MMPTIAAVKLATLVFLLSAFSASGCAGRDRKASARRRRGTPKKGASK